MKKHFQILLLLTALSGAETLRAQANLQDSSIFITEVKMSYAAQLPGADLAKRFGLNSALGFGVNFKFRSNLMLGLEGSFLTGNRITDTTVLQNLKASNGEIYDLNGEFARVLIYERGWLVTGVIGYVWPVIGPNPNSGILMKAGFGFMQHKIRIESNRNPVPSLAPEYLKGYDRLVNGFTFQQFIGYQYLSNKRLINFFAGIEFYEGLTRNRRSFNYDLMRAETDHRLDVLYGIRAGWILPIYARPPKEYYYN